MIHCCSSEARLFTAKKEVLSGDMLMCHINVWNDMKNASTPLTPTERAVLDRLEQCYDVEETVTREVAVEQLTSVGMDASDAYELLEQLRLKGYLYGVAGGLRLTPRI